VEIGLLEEVKQGRWVLLSPFAVLVVWSDAGLVVWSEAGLVVWSEAGLVVWSDAGLVVWSDGGRLPVTRLE
jgi:hypothetical protein